MVSRADWGVLVSTLDGVVVVFDVSFENSLFGMICEDSVESDLDVVGRVAG